MLPHSHMHSRYKRIHLSRSRWLGVSWPGRLLVWQIASQGRWTSQFIQQVQPETEEAPGIGFKMRKLNSEHGSDMCQKIGKYFSILVSVVCKMNSGCSDKNRDL